MYLYKSRAMKTLITIILLSIIMPSMAVDTLKVKKQADSLYKEGVTAIGSGQYAKAIVVLQNALKENEKIGNSANTLIAIGYVYIQTKKYNEAVSYFEQVYNENKGQAKCAAAINLAGCYDLLGKKSLVEKFYNEAYEISKSIKDVEKQIGVLENLASFYTSNKRYNEALSKLLLAESLCGETNIAVVNHSVVLSNIGDVYSGKKEFNKAIDSYQKSLDILDSNSLFLSSTAVTYLGLSLAYEKNGDCINSLATYKKYSEIKDTVFNINNFEHINQLQTQFGTERKEKEIKELQQARKIQELANEHNSFINKVYLGVILLGVLILVLSYLGYNKLKTAKKIIEHKNKDIIDSINYARRIQTSVMPSEKYIEETLNRLMKK